MTQLDIGRQKRGVVVEDATEGNLCLIYCAETVLVLCPCFSVVCCFLWIGYAVWFVVLCMQTNREPEDPSASQNIIMYVVTGVVMLFGCLCVLTIHRYALEYAISHKTPATPVTVSL